MNYIVLDIEVPAGEAYLLDILSQQLADTGFESFEQSHHTLHAYIPESAFNWEQVQAILCSRDLLPAVTRMIAEENWNKRWESNYEPVAIENRIFIRASFHLPPSGFDHDLIIDPKMAFGTGHHATTYLMAKEMLNFDLAGSTVLDMGCGTGILAILAEKLGAWAIDAADIDQRCLISTLANAEVNGCTKINILQGDIMLHKNWPGQKYDVILANIHRSVLLDQMALYRGWLTAGGNGTLLISGFYEADLSELIAEAAKNSLHLVETFNRDLWFAARLST